MKHTLEENIDSPSLESPARREFLRKMGLAGIAGFALLAGCAGAQKDLKDPSQFDMKSFVSWYKRNKLYNGPNPNLNRPHSVADYSLGPTFKLSIDHGWTPGIGYSVPAGKLMIAVAPGVVSEIGEVTGRGAKGLYIKVLHPYESRFSGYMIQGPYSSWYNHVSDPLVGMGKVERGQPLCHVPVIHCEHAKLYILEQGNHVDPDNYGSGHSYMQYQEGPLPIDEENEKNLFLVEEKIMKQRNLIVKLEILPAF